MKIFKLNASITHRFKNNREMLGILYQLLTEFVDVLTKRGKGLLVLSLRPQLS
jgi:hypothetical protein